MQNNCKYNHNNKSLFDGGTAIVTSNGKWLQCDLVSELSFCLRRHHHHHLRRYGNLLIFIVRLRVFLLGAVPLSLLFLFAFVFVNSYSFKQPNKQTFERRTSRNKNKLAHQHWDCKILWIHLRKSSRNCRKKTAFTCAFGARLSFFSVIVYWIRSSGRSLLE